MEIQYTGHKYGKSVPIEKLVVDLDVQRAIVPYRVDKLSRNWDSSLVGELLVFANADGTFNIGDGHHRQVVAASRGVRSMDCEIFYGVSKADQARIFLGRNDRGSIARVDRDRNLATLRDPDTLLINAAAQKAGLVFIGNSSEQVTFGDRASAVAIMNDARRRFRDDNGSQHLADVMTFYCEVFASSLARGERVEPTLLKGLSKVMLRKPELDRDWLASRLVSQAPQSIVAHGQLWRKQAQAERHNMSATRATAQLIASWYNTYAHKATGKRIGKL
jgi:hypothetical protein